jgi:hypothetical protein
MIPYNNILVIGFLVKAVGLDRKIIIRERGPQKKRKLPTIIGKLRETT